MLGLGWTKEPMVACDQESPHQPVTVRKNKMDVLQSVRGNRPYGHDGDHGYSTDRYAMVYAWTDDGKVIR